jgi:hypothetical protein
MVATVARTYSTVIGALLADPHQRVRDVVSQA